MSLCFTRRCSHILIPLPQRKRLEQDLLWKLFKTSLCGEKIFMNIHEFHFLLPCSFETSCCLPRNTEEKKWLCFKCHFWIYCIFDLVICASGQNLFRSIVGNIFILSLKSNIFSLRLESLRAETMFSVGYLHSAYLMRVLFHAREPCHYPKPNKWAA